MTTRTTLSRRKFLAASAAAAAFPLVHVSKAEAQQGTLLRWAHVYESNEPYHTWAEWVGTQFAQRTNGRYRIQVFAASSLGNEPSINEGLALGTVDMIYTGQLFAGRAHGPIAIGGAPYMFRDFGHWRGFRGSDLFRELTTAYDRATGHRALALTYYGERHVTSNKAINRPEDMRNLKIRVPQAPLYRMFPEAVGANPTPIAFAEVYLALQQGTVDAQENPLPTIQAKKFHEVQTHINLTGHIVDSLLTIVGAPGLQKVQAGDRDLLFDLIRQAADNCTNEITRLERELVGWFRQQGETVVEVDRAPFRAAVQPRHNGPAATWTQAIYDRVQNLPSAAS